MSFSRTMMLEPDIIAANENILPEVSTDLINAKNYLKQQSAPTGDTLYDHLVDLIQKLITQKPPDVVDSFEHYSWQLKLEKLKPNFDLLHDIYMTPPQLQLVRRVESMFTLLDRKAAKIEDYGEEDEEEINLEEETWKTKTVDLIEHNYYFKEGGLGLPESEAYLLFTALKMLGYREPVSTTRFFGKIYGSKANYYIAETDLTIEELDRKIREFDLKNMPGEEAAEEEEEKQEMPEERLGEGEEMKTTEPQPPKLPAIPQSTWQPAQAIPVERPGQGVNRKFYWVCNNIGDQWIALPDVTPEQIRVARLNTRTFTGDLEAEVSTYPPFPGNEANYLRAQIARIAAATSISPRGFYTFGSGEEEDIDMEEGGDIDFNQNIFYRGHSLRDLLDKNLTFWVHHGRYILPQGRTIWWNPNPMVEGEEEEEDENIERILPEIGPSLMCPLSEDQPIEQMRAWATRLSSTFSPERAVVTLRSNRWPGAIAYANAGKKSECMYIGWGIKFLSPNHTPLQLPKIQEEYPIGPEVMEIADPTFADEEAYRIAHLPPLPPPVFGEGEGLEGEILDEDED